MPRHFAREYEYRRLRSRLHTAQPADTATVRLRLKALLAGHHRERLVAVLPGEAPHTS